MILRVIVALISIEAVDLLDRNYRIKSVVTQIPHNAGRALFLMGEN